jgi:hypothetical protein
MQSFIASSYDKLFATERKKILGKLLISVLSNLVFNYASIWNGIKTNLFNTIS